MTQQEAKDYQHQLIDMGLGHAYLWPSADTTALKVQYMHIVYGQWVVETTILRNADDCEFFLEKCSDGLILDTPIAV